jgi:hypothetical protein
MREVGGWKLHSEDYEQKGLGSGQWEWDSGQHSAQDSLPAGSLWVREKQTLA